MNRSRFEKAMKRYCREHKATTRTVSEIAGVTPAVLRQLIRAERRVPVRIMDSLPPELGRAAALDARDSYRLEARKMEAIAKALSPPRG